MVLASWATAAAEGSAPPEPELASAETRRPPAAVAMARGPWATAAAED